MLLPLQADAQLAIGKARRRPCVGRRRAEGGRRSFIGSATRRCSPAPGRWARPRRPIETGIEVARRQNAKSWELRGAMSLARLHRQQSRHEEAVACLRLAYRRIRRRRSAGRPHPPQRPRNRKGRTPLGRTEQVRGLKAHGAMINDRDGRDPFTSSEQQRRPSGGNRRQVPAGGVVENVLVAGHQYGIRHSRRGDDQPVSWVAMKYVW